MILWASYVAMIGVLPSVAEMPPLVGGVLVLVGAFALVTARRRHHTIA